METRGIQMEKVFKYSLQITLFGAFLGLIVIAMIDLHSEQTSVSITHVKVKPHAPALTICPWISTTKASTINHTEILDKMKDGSEFPINVTLQYGNIKMTDPSALKEHFNVSWNEVWSVRCKFYNGIANCSPCLTFNPPSEMLLDRFTVISLIHNPNAEQFGVELHEPGQSSTYSNQLNLARSLYVKFKKGFVSVTYRDVLLKLMKSRKKRSSPCDTNNSQKRELDSIAWITEKLGCNLPWSNYKKSSLPLCTTNEQMKKYFEIGSNFDENYPNGDYPNCHQYIWDATDYFTDYSFEKTNHSTITIGLMSFMEKVEIIEEVKMYELKNFIGDFGGYLGLLLGGSIPGLISAFQHFSSYALKALRAH